MNNHHHLALLLFCTLLCSLHCVSALYADIYRTLDAAPCVMLLDKSGPVGCTTPQGGISADLQVITTSDQLNEFVNNPPSDSKAVALPSSLFNNIIVNKLDKTGKVKGLLILYGPPAVDGWSPDSTTPNSDWGLKTTSTFEWNPPGDKLNFIKIPFPVYSLSEEETQNILTLNTSSTSSYPRHAVRFSTFMHATMNAETCLRRGQCLPVGGKSVWSSFNKVGSRPIIMAMANIDSTALFHDLAIGADSTTSGIVGLLGAALALQNVNRDAFVKDIVFAFWAGESWGYLGSRKFLNDIQNFQCEDADLSTGTCTKPYKPDLAFQAIKLQNIEAAIELNQIGMVNESAPSLFIHQQTKDFNPVASLLQSSSAGVDTSFQVVNNTEQPGIPPSSLMSFLLANGSLPGAVVTDYKTVFANRNFHSQSDSGAFNALSSSTLCDAATVLARTLYILAAGSPDSVSDSIEAPCAFLSDLATCLTSNFSCDLISNFMPSPRSPINTYYAGVFGSSIQNAYASAPAVMVYTIMSLATSSNAFYNFTAFNFTSPPAGCKDCNGTCVNDYCVFSETHYHDALSVGLDWDYGSNKWIVVNESEPIWVESNWDSVGAQIFLRDSPGKEAGFLVAGIIEFILSLVAVYFAKKYFMRNYKIF